MADRRDIVLLYGPPWHGAAQFSKHHLARHLGAAGHRVLYVEAPLGPLTLLKRRSEAAEGLRDTFRRPRLAAERVWITRHFNPIAYHSVTPLTARRQANRMGQRLLAPAVRADLRRLGFRAPMLIAGLPHAVDLVPRLSHRGLVYHCADDYTHVRGFPASLATLEEALCRRADLVVATAETLAADRARFNPRTFWIPNGVDLEHFTRPAAPAADLEQRAAGRRVVGFVGGLAQWVDVPLLRRVALARPDVLVALVGPLSTDLSLLAGVPNVACLGPRSYARVPSYLAAMDVALIPFVQDPVTLMADPIKAYEYLAAGVPVVSTDLPALRRLAHVVRLAGSHDAFIAAVTAALEAGRGAGQSARQEEARQHCWFARFTDFERLVEDYVPG